MKFTQSLFTSLTIGLVAGLSTGSAHVSVGGDRTLGIINAGQTVTNDVRTVSSSFGWADATDASWGDSHRTTAFKFTLTSTQTITIAVQRRNAIGQTGALDILLPAFSLYTTPLFVSETHDPSVPTMNYLTGLFGTTAVAESFSDLNSNGIWEPGESFTDTNGNGVWDGAGIGGSGKEGALSTLTPWKIFSDTSGVLNFDTIIGHAADGTSANYGNAAGINGDGIADGMVRATFADLAAGDYYFFVGGADYLAQNTDPVGTSFKTYGVSVAVTAAPEPTSAVLLGLGLAGFCATRRRPRQA